MCRLRHHDCREAMWSIKNGDSTPVRLSEQHVMDCSHRDNVDYFDINYKNIGCSGGYLDEYFKFMVEQGVIDYSVYPLPYSATDQPCVHDAADVKFKGINNGRHTSKTVSGIVSLLERGPLVIAITAGGTTFNRYKTGVLNTEDGCPESVGLNHAVTVVGYGSYQVEEQLNPPIQSCNKDKTKRDCTGAGEFWSQGQCCTEISSMTVDKNYYLVQNSWSSNYGDGGFVRFNAQDGNGICGMNRWVTYLNV